MRVPRYERQVEEQVGSANLMGGVDAKLRPAVESISRTLKHAQDTAVGIYERERKRAIDADVNGATAALKNIKRQALYGDGDKKEGFLSYKNKMAAENEAKTYEEFKKEKDRILNSVTNPEARKLIARKAVQIEGTLRDKMSGHSFVEMQNYEKEEFTGFLEANRNEAIDEYDIIEKVDGKKMSVLKGNLKESMQKIKEFGKGRGWNSDMIKNMQVEESTQIHSGVINRMISEDKDMEAKAYFNDIKDKGELTPDARAKLQDLVAMGSVLGEAQRFSDQLAMKGLSESEGLEKIRSIKDPEKRRATSGVWKQRKADERRISRDNETAFYRRNYKQMEASEGRMKLTANILSNLNSNQVQTLLKRKSQLLSGKPIENDYGKWRDFVMLSKDDPEAFMALTVDHVRPWLDDAHLDQFIKMQSSLKKNDDSVAEGYRTTTQIVKDAAAVAGIKNKKDLSAFSSYIDRAFVNWQKTNPNKILTLEEKNDIIRRSLVKMRIDRPFLWDPEKRFYKTNRKMKTYFQLSDQNEDLRDWVERTLRRQGKKVTDQNAIDLINRRANY